MDEFEIIEAEEIDDEKKDVCHNFALKLIGMHKFKTIPGKKEDEIWVYTNGYYQPIGKHVIKKYCEGYLGKVCKTHIVNEVINKIGRMTMVNKNNFICKSLNLICLENGVYDINKNQLLEHSPDYNFTAKLPIIFNLSATCSKIIHFLEEVIYEEDIPVIQEWLGYCLWRNYFIKKGLVCVGASDTGKTTFINLLVKFIGEDNTSGASLQALTGDKFSTSTLFNKFTNIYDDMSANDLDNVGKFKMITGGGWLSGEKKFGDQFQFKNYAKLTFACNRIPLSKQDDDDDAYYKRWLIIRFDHVFDKNNKATNKNLINQLTSKKEMSGLFNWALIGLRRLLKNQDFSYKLDFDEIRNLITYNSNDVAKFVQDCCVKGDKDN